MRSPRAFDRDVLLSGISVTQALSVAYICGVILSVRPWHTTLPYSLIYAPCMALHSQMTISPTRLAHSVKGETCPRKSLWCRQLGLFLAEYR
jgi:hypothetical protein